MASIALGYYFNHQFVQEYSTPSSNPIWGPGSWQEFIALGYANPAAGSASQDYTIMSVILLPLFTIVDGRRRGIRIRGCSSCRVLFTSCAFALRPSTSRPSSGSADTNCSVTVDSPA